MYDPQQQQIQDQSLRSSLPLLYVPSHRPVNVQDVQHLFHQDKEWLPSVPRSFRAPQYHSQYDPNLSAYWERKHEFRDRVKAATRLSRVLREERKNTSPRLNKGLSPHSQSVVVTEGEGGEESSKFESIKPKFPLQTCEGVKEEELCALRAVLMPPTALGRTELDVRWMDVGWVAKAVRNHMSVKDLAFQLNIAEFEPEWDDEILKTTPLIDSPRSMLVMFRNGSVVLDLLRRNDDYVRELGGTKRDSETLSALRKHIEELRTTTLAKLREDYAALCAVVTQQDFLDVLTQDTPLESEERKHKRIMNFRKKSVNSDLFLERRAKELGRIQRTEDLHISHAETQKQKQRDLYEQQLQIEEAFANRTQDKLMQMKERGLKAKAVIREKQRRVEEYWDAKKIATEKMRDEMDIRIQERNGIVHDRRESRKQRLREITKKAAEKGVLSRNRVAEDKEKHRLEVERMLETKNEQAKERREYLDHERMQTMQQRHEVEEQRMETLRRVREESEAKHELLVLQIEAEAQRVNEFTQDRSNAQCMKAQALRRQDNARLKTEEVDPRIMTEHKRALARQAAQQLRYEMLQEERRQQLKDVAQQERNDMLAKMFLREKHLNEKTFQNLCSKSTELVKKEQREKVLTSQARLVKRTRDLRERLAMKHVEFLHNMEDDMVQFRKEVYHDFLCKKDNVKRVAFRDVQSSMN